MLSLHSCFEIHVPRTARSRGTTYLLALSIPLLILAIAAGCDRVGAHGDDEKDGKKSEQADKIDAHTASATEHEAAKHDDEHEKGVVKLEEYDQERIGLKVAAVTAAKHRPEAKAF